MHTIDIHAHIMPADIPRWADKFGYSGFIHLEHHKSCCAKMMIDDRFFREVQSNCWDPSVRMKDCDQYRVDVQVLSTIPVLFHYWANAKDAYDTSRFFNDHIASVVKSYPNRFVGLGTLPMQDTSLAVKEMERCKNELGMPGVEIGSHINEMNLEDERLHDFYAAAEELGVALFVHPWDMMGKEKMEKYWLPWLVGMPAETSLAICSMIFGGIFERFPRLRVAFAHGGGSFPMTIGRINHGFDVRPDLCAIDNEIRPDAYLGHFWVDSLVHSPEVLRYNAQLLGSDKICLGTDYPFPLGELSPGKLIQTTTGLSDETKADMLGINALRWLNMEGHAF